jgi:hypothetical protein
MRTSLPATAVAIALLGCGSGVTSGGSTIARRGPEPCPTEGELRLGRVCWSPIGSRWHLTAFAPGGEYAFDVELLPANRLRATDHPAAGPSTDEWFVDGNTLRLFLANRYVEYRADVTNGTVVIGQAINARGSTWDWRGDRQQIGGGCAADEAQVGETCVAIAGTRWTLHGDGADMIVAFQGDSNGDGISEIFVEGSADAAGDDTWSQNGATLTLRFDGGARELTATVTGVDRLSGSGRDSGGRTWEWSAERIPLYPPPIH